MLHGAEAAAAAEEAARVAFEAGGLSADMPTLALKAADLAATSHSALMVAAGFAASNSEARKQIANGGFRINGEKVADPQASVALSGGEAELRSGKRRVRLVIEP
jgi:tyrosyl-tRNA synthetase